MIVVDAIENTLGIKFKRVRCIHISNRGSRPPMIAPKTEPEIQIDRVHAHAIDIDHVSVSTCISSESSFSSTSPRFIVPRGRI